MLILNNLTGRCLRHPQRRSVWFRVRMAAKRLAAALQSGGTGNKKAAEELPQVKKFRTLS